MRQLILDLVPEAAPGLDNFVAGGNGETMAGLALWLAPESREPSLLLWGEVGAGKTHLLRATQALYSDACADPDLADLVESSQNIEQIQAVDNVEALSESGQIALFNLFNRLRTSGGKLLTASSQPPLQLCLREDLRTRLGSGLIYRLHPLTDSEQIDALTSQARARGLRLPPGALDYLLARAPRDMRCLSSILAALDLYSLEHKRTITMPLLREVLQSSLD